MHFEIYLSLADVFCLANENMSKMRGTEMLLRNMKT